MTTMKMTLTRFARHIGFTECAEQLADSYIKTLPKGREITYDIVQDVVLEVIWPWTIEEFYDNTNYRKSEFVLSRSFCFLFGRLLTTLSFRELGVSFGKDHATVLTGIKTLLGQMYLPKNRQTFENIISEFALRDYVIDEKVRKVVNA